MVDCVALSRLDQFWIAVVGRSHTINSLDYQSVLRGVWFSVTSWSLCWLEG